MAYADCHQPRLGLAAKAGAAADGQPAAKGVNFMSLLPPALQAQLAQTFIGGFFGALDLLLCVEQGYGGFGIIASGGRRETGDGILIVHGVYSLIGGLGTALPCPYGLGGGKKTTSARGIENAIHG